MITRHTCYRCRRGMKPQIKSWSVSESHCIDFLLPIWFCNVFWCFCVWHSQHPGSQTARPAADWWRCCQSPAPAWVERACWRWFSCPPCEQSRPGWPQGWRCAEASASFPRSPGGERAKVWWGRAMTAKVEVHMRYEVVFFFKHLSWFIWLVVSSRTNLCEGLRQVGHHLVPVLGQDVVQGGSSLAVLPKHEEAWILLIGRWRRAVVLKVLHWNAE